MITRAKKFYKQKFRLLTIALEVIEIESNSEVLISFLDYRKIFKKKKIIKKDGRTCMRKYYTIFCEIRTLCYSEEWFPYKPYVNCLLTTVFELD